MGQTARRWHMALGLALALALSVASVPALAQQPDLVLGLHRDFGYAAGGRIQGAFSLTVNGREDLVEVRYLLDGEVMAVMREPPFRFRFNTGDYPLGPHILSAIGVTAQGEEVRSNERRLEFVSADEGWRTVERIVLPLVGLFLVLMLVAGLGPLVLDRTGRGFRPGEYGAAGGAVCPRCGLPFSRHRISPNLLVGKLERCPHCGRWAVVARASVEQLRRAEAKRAQEASRGQMEMETEEKRLRRLMEESRFEE